MSIQFSIIEKQSVTIVKLQGKILSELDLEEVKHKMEGLSNNRVVFELSELTHTNSSGIAFLIRIMTRSRINDGDVVLASPNVGIQKLIDISKLYEVFSIYNSLDEAVSHFNK
jgi:anti-sigma B factor antagonist